MFILLEKEFDCRSEYKINFLLLKEDKYSQLLSAWKIDRYTAQFEA